MVQCGKAATRVPAGKRSGQMVRWGASCMVVRCEKWCDESERCEMLCDASLSVEVSVTGARFAALKRLTPRSVARSDVLDPVNLLASQVRPEVRKAQGE